MKTPLSVHALFHTANIEGQKIYSELYKLLCRDIDNPFSDGLDIPVYYATSLNWPGQLISKGITNTKFMKLF